MRTSKGLMKRTTYKRKGGRARSPERRGWLWSCSAETSRHDEPSLPAMPMAQTSEGRGRNASRRASSSDSLLTNAAAEGLSGGQAEHFDTGSRVKGLLFCRSGKLTVKETQPASTMYEFSLKNNLPASIPGESNWTEMAQVTSANSLELGKQNNRQLNR